VPSIPDYVLANRAYWDQRAASYVVPGERHWAQADPNWGIWGVTEADVRMIPADLAGKYAIELGCGTAYVSSWLARRGAHLLRDSGFEIEDLIEIQPPKGATTRYPGVTLDWARKWPAEEVWKVRKRA